MKRDDLLRWAAGYYEGCGTITIHPEQGPIQKYLSITINMRVAGDNQKERLLAVIHNGTAFEATFEVSGIAAVKGFWREIWPYLSAEGRAQANAALRHYRANKNFAKKQTQADTA